MNPSSPSNADTPAGVTFKVSTRALTADFLAARVDESNRELGSVDAAALAALLEKLAALDPTEIHDADPQLIATGRRGRFSIRPVRGRFLLRSATDAGQNFVELSAADVPAFLDGRDLAPTDTASPPVPVTAIRTDGSKRATAFALFALSILVVALSAGLTFRTTEVDPDSDYEAVTAATEVAARRATAAGTYVSGSGDDERTLEVAPDGAVRYREYGPNREISDDREGSSTVARRRADKMIVLRVKDLGTVDLKTPDSVIFARDTYQRRPAGGSVHP
jgi:hypothetical protein